MKRTTHTLALLAMIILLSACSALGKPTPTEPSPDAGDLAATQTARGAIEGTPPIILSAVPIASETATPLPASTATKTPLATNTVPATVTLWTVPPVIVPSSTPVRTPTSYSTLPILPPCNFVEVKDITVDPGTDFAPNEPFTKTWRFTNIGSCTWTTAYTLVYLDGTPMTGTGIYNLPTNVAPGKTLDMSIDMQAPGKANNYIGTWMLKSDTGKTFGSGPAANIPFVVEIDVLDYLPVSIHFAQRFCDATWVSDAGTLPCPDTDKDPDNKGYVRKDEKPRLETGAYENEVALLTYPQMVNNGYISAKFPPYTVKANEHLYTVLSCKYGATDCDVMFWIDYQVAGTTTYKNLGSWNERYDDTLTYVDLDLAALVGQSVHFIFRVEAHGGYKQDEALWLSPVIDVP